MAAWLRWLHGLGFKLDLSYIMSKIGGNWPNLHSVQSTLSIQSMFLLGDFGRISLEKFWKSALLRLNLEAVLTYNYEAVNAVLATCTVTNESTLTQVTICGRWLANHPPSGSAPDIWCNNTKFVMPPTGYYICTYICIIIQSITYLFTMYIHLM